MPKLRSLTSQLYRAARISKTSAPPRGSLGAYAKRQVRRRVYRTGSGITRSILKAFELSK